MGQYDYDYEIPENFSIQFSGFLQQNGAGEIGMHIRNCDVDFDDVGLAYYAGLRGDNWDKHAVDVTIIGREEDVLYLKNVNASLKDKIQRFLRPSKSGLLVRNIDFMISGNLVLEGKIKRPDFKIIDADTGDIWYWEHCGMMSDAKYVKRWADKEKFYAKNGIVRGQNLIVTEEHNGEGLDSFKINELIRDIFML